MRSLTLLSHITPKARFISSTAATRSSSAKLTSTTSRKLKSQTPPLSLESFIQRQRVLSLYRTILRSIFEIPKSPNRSETIGYARVEFERNRHVEDVTQIRYLISTGKTEFEKMERYIHELASR